jgi:hypothetical protein
VLIQRVKGPTQKAPERWEADPGQEGRPTWAKRGDESPIHGVSRATGSERVGRNIK